MTMKRQYVRYVYINLFEKRDSRLTALIMEVLGDASVCLPMMTKNENIKTCNKHHFASCLNHHCKGPVENLRTIIFDLCT